VKGRGGDGEMGSIRHFRELDVYRIAMEAAMGILKLTKGFPVEERYSLLEGEYEHILGKLVTMLSHPDQWGIRSVREEEVPYA
jgi:hypothetical protein